MTSGMNFWDIGVWRFMIELSLVFGSMLFANMLRRLIKPLRRSLIPSSVLAGFILLGADWAWKRITGSTLFATSTLEILTYHGLGLGFVALTLKSGEQVKDEKMKKDAFSTGVIVVATYLLQALAGLIVTVAMFYLIGSWACSGLLLPMGYGQGPGQAYNWGNVYEHATAYLPFPDGTSFGLTVAAMGFVSASIGGIIYLTTMRKKGRITQSIANPEETEDLTAAHITAKGEIPLTESLDKMTVQFALIFLTYMAAYAFMNFASVGLDSLGGFFQNTVKPLIWGFNFLIGIIFAILLKAVMRSLRKKNIVHREYFNNFMLSRIAGVMFDIMVTASIAAISLSAFRNPEFVLPLAIICVLGGVITYVYLGKLCGRIYPNYADEAFLSLYGMLTGTASTGVILLREIDPMFETPAADNLVYQQPWAIVFGFPMLLLLGLAPRSMSWTYITMVILLALFISMNVIIFSRMKKK